MEELIQVSDYIPQVAASRWFKGAVRQIKAALQGRQVKSLVNIKMGSPSESTTSRYQYLAGEFGWRIGENERDFLLGQNGNSTTL